jgi:hypothetical protein
MTTLPLTWAMEPAAGRTLFLVFAYHGRDRDRPMPNWIERLEGPGSHGHLIVHRDHYANPRALAYQVAMMRSAADRLSPHEPPAIVVDSAFPTVAVAGMGEPIDLVNPRFWRDSLAARAREFANVVAIYPDALGLGCADAERRLVRECGSIVVVNGRRRVFRVDARMSSRLDRHRWLASTRVVERAMAQAVKPFAATLAAWDRLRGIV